jgi:F0F1-type ATP synthase assembly protein I
MREIISERRESKKKTSSSSSHTTSPALARAWAYGMVVAEMIISVIGGLFIGMAFDRRFESEPIFTILLLFVGVIVGFFLLFRLARKLEKEA